LGKPASPHATTVIPRKQRLRWATPQTSTLGSYTKGNPTQLNMIVFFVSDCVRKYRDFSFLL